MKGGSGIHSADCCNYNAVLSTHIYIIASCALFELQLRWCDILLGAMVKYQANSFKRLF